LCTVIDHGFEGPLRFGLYILPEQSPIFIEKGEQVVQVINFKTPNYGKKYEGQYKGSR